jgi:hypothetical protein
MLLVACAWCERIRLDHWVEEREALRRLRTYEWPDPPSFTHSICDECVDRLARRREAGQPEAAAA